MSNLLSHLSTSAAVRCDPDLLFGVQGLHSPGYADLAASLCRAGEAPAATATRCIAAATAVETRGPDLMESTDVSPTLLDLLQFGVKSPIGISSMPLTLDTRLEGKPRRLFLEEPLELDRCEPEAEAEVVVAAKSARGFTFVAALMSFEQEDEIGDAAPVT